MMKKIVELLKNIYGAVLMISILAGAVVAIIFIVGFIFGGTIGAQFALLGGKIMSYCISIAAVACLFGLIGFYTENVHELTIDFSQDQD